MHGALISTALISAGMLLYDWRMALALLWVVPASLLMVYLSRRMEKRHITKGLVTRRAATDAMQEVLELSLIHIFRRIDMTVPHGTII